MADYICIDIGGSAIKHAVITAEGTIKHNDSLKTPDSLSGLIATIKDIQTRYNEVETFGIAVSMPGLVDADTGHVIHGGALTFIQNVNIRERLMTECGVPVQIENDGKSAALGEHWLGNLVGVENGIALVIGTGIGGGIIVHNKLLKGHHLTAGEFSYIRTALTNDFHDLFAVQGSAQVLSQTYAASKGLPKEEMDGKQFFEAVNQNDPIAQELLASYAEKIALQLMNLQTILDPEIITIGGGISRQATLFTAIDKQIDTLVSNFPLPMTRPTVRQSRLGNHANLLGALVNFKAKESQLS